MSTSERAFAADAAQPAEVAEPPAPGRNEVRERLLRAAMDIVDRQGIQALTQSRVAAAAGVRQSHLTYYFPTRSDLLKEVVRGGCSAFVALLGEGAAAGTNALDHLRQVFVERCGDTSTARLMIGLTLAAEEDVSLKRWLIDLDHHVIASLRSSFARLGLHPSDDDLALFHATFIGTAILNLSGRSSDVAGRTRRQIDLALDRLVEQSRMGAPAGPRGRDARSTATDRPRSAKRARRG